MAGEAAHAAELAVTPHYVPILAILPVSPGADAQDEASDDEALGLVSLLGQIRVVGAHFLSNEGPWHERVSAAKVERRQARETCK